MARSCSTSASASGTAGADGESRPGVVSLAHLLQGPDAAPPGYLTLSLTPAGKARPRRKQPGEVTLRHIDAPRDYLKLSVTPSDQDEPSTVAGDTSSGAAETTLALPHKKRKLAPCVCQETVASSSRSLALAIVTHGDDNASQSTEPMDAIPLQAVYYDHARIASHQFRLSRGARDITTNDAASTSGSAEAEAPFSAEPIDALPLRAAPRRYILLAADAAPSEPAWIRTTLGLPARLRLSFITQKRIERSDLDFQQSRLLIPSGEVARLLPLLSENGLRAANLDKPWMRPKRQTSSNHSYSSDEKKARAQGKKHGGLVVPVYINHAGDRMNAELTRWTSNGNTVLKFGSHRSFVDVSGLKVMDEIQIWAFQQDGGLMCLVIAKIDGGEPPAAPAGGQQSRSPLVTDSVRCRTPVTLVPPRLREEARTSL